jgi:hypothetical protein
MWQTKLSTSMLPYQKGKGSKADSGIYAEKLTL